MSNTNTSANTNAYIRTSSSPNTITNRMMIEIVLIIFILHMLLIILFVCIYAHAHFTLLVLGLVRDPLKSRLLSLSAHQVSTYSMLLNIKYNVWTWYGSNNEENSKQRVNQFIDVIEMKMIKE